MKLRNKNTGEVMELLNATVCTNDGLLRNRAKNYDSLAELNEEWEDYKPTEPLIKDEKTRKAVRAWAEANGIVKAFIITFDDMWKIYGDDVVRDRFGIEFSNRLSFEEDGETGDYYTIAELCGDEKE